MLKVVWHHTSLSYVGYRPNRIPRKFLNQISRESISISKQEEVLKPIKVTYAGFKRMFWNHVFCPIVLFTNPSKAGCVSPHLRRATFLPFDIKTFQKMRRKPQHVGNVRADVPNMLRFLSHFCNGFYIKWQKCDAT